MADDLITDNNEALEAIGEGSEGMSQMADMGEGLSEGMDAPEGGGSNSGFWPGPLGNTEPDDDIDEVEGFRFGKKYTLKYLQRGMNKLTQSGTTAGEDLLLAMLNMIMYLVGMTKDGEENTEENSEESDGDDDIEVDFKSQ